MDTSSRRKIAVVTGSRSEYGILYCVMRAIQNHPKLSLTVVACGMHTLPSFGNTIEFIKKDGFSVDAVVPMKNESDDSSSAMAASVAHGIEGMCVALAKTKPDLVLVLGDRTEALAASIAATYSGIPVAHIHGGDNARAGIDEMARGAITKFSHIHFPATKKSAARILNLGEAKWRIHMVGSPAVDFIRNQPLRTKEELFGAYGFDPSKPLILCIQHPVTTQVSNASRQIELTLHALKHLGIQTLLVYPNADAGGRMMIARIEAAKSSLPFVHMKTSLPHTDYLSFMKHASVMVGNSSSGIIEAPSFGTPCVNIGIRQDGRERGANVIDVGHNEGEIIAALKKALTPAFSKKAQGTKSPYGDGKASERIAKVLAEVQINAKLLEKRMMEE